MEDYDKKPRGAENARPRAARIMWVGYSFSHAPLGSNGKLWGAWSGGPTGFYPIYLTLNLYLWQRRNTAEGFGSLHIFNFENARTSSYAVAFTCFLLS